MQPGASVTRFAPSPTGYLHAGHAAHMLYVWGVAGLLGGRVLLRVEDHDRQRCRPDYEAALLEDLDWLGFEPANAVRADPSEFRQSDCDRAYATALDRLAARGLVYRCTCSRRALERVVPAAADGERPYPGLCRGRNCLSSSPHGLRLAWEDGAPPESFDDGFLGSQCQRPERQCGDLLLRDWLGQWTYQFAVTVDDARHGVDFVVRGSDLLSSTGRQRRLARLLGHRGPSRYFHHPLALDQTGAKLGKRRRSPAIREQRRAGACPEAVLGEAARLAGLLAAPLGVRARDAADLVGSRHGGLESQGPHGTLPSRALA